MKLKLYHLLLAVVLLVCAAIVLYSKVYPERAKLRFEQFFSGLEHMPIFFLLDS
jgi:hypothetical protein